MEEDFPLDLDRNPGDLQVVWVRSYIINRATLTLGLKHAPNLGMKAPSPKC